MVVEIFFMTKSSQKNVHGAGLDPSASCILSDMAISELARLVSFTISIIRTFTNQRTSGPVNAHLISEQIISTKPCYK